MRDSSPQEFEDLLQGWCNDTLTDSEFERLETILTNDQGARHAYLRLRNLHSALHERCEGDTILEMQAKPRHWRLPILPWACLAAALVAVIGYVSLRPSPQESNSPAESSLTSSRFAVLTEAVDVVWENPSSMPHAGGAFELGTIALKSGLAHIDFFCGASVVLEGPGKLEFLSTTEGILHHGKLRAHVPEQARGFTISTAQAEVVDLGTEFGIECDPLGQTAEIHVFDGEVEVRDLSSFRQPTRLITSGSGLKFAHQKSWTTITSDIARFAGVSEVTNRAEVQMQDRAEFWQQNHQAILQHPALVAYYDFENTGRTRLLEDRGPNQIDGAIVGCNWEEGRWRGKGALEFKQSGDRVRLHIPGSFDSLTTMAWLRIDGFDRKFNSILLSDRFDDGHAHWQVRASGEIDLGIKPLGKKRVLYLSEPLLGQSDLGRWLHLAMAYDSNSQTVRHYIDGTLVASFPITDRNLKLQLGACELGNWSPVDPQLSSPIRNFNGRLDEFAIFSDALTTEAIAQFYLVGRPS